MRRVVARRPGRDAQTVVFFALAMTTIILLCGLAIDSGLLYLAKARLSRAVDGAALAAVGNFHQSNDLNTNLSDVANIMCNFCIANYPALNPSNDPISTTPTISSASTTQSNGQPATIYTYTYSDNKRDAVSAGGNYKRYVQVSMLVGQGGEITSASVNARCPVTTYFIGLAGSFYSNLKVSSSAVATRNPRLIMIVVDRSASMLETYQGYGGAYGLPQAIVTFLNFFDTTSDYIGLVSFGSNARLEMPLTTNFLVAGTNILYDSYQTDPNEEAGIPGLDPEDETDNQDYTNAYGVNGVRRLKFGGLTAADDGFRLAMEQLLSSSSFNNPNVLKYMVVFTDGAWNTTRTLLAAPAYTNIVTEANPLSYPNIPVSTANQNFWLITLPCESPYGNISSGGTPPALYTAINHNTNDGTFYASDHAGDYWLSTDGTSYEPLSGSHTQIVGGTTTNMSVGTEIAYGGGLYFYTTSLNVWLQPGAVGYYKDGGVTTTYLSDLTNPTQTININMDAGSTFTLVVPGYIVDGLFADNLDLPYPDGTSPTDPNTGDSTTYPRYRSDNYAEPFMWPDDTGTPGTTPYVVNSSMRALMYRNYVNLLTGFYVMKPDDPLSTNTDPLTGAARPLNGLGPYYPGAAFYWPFDLVGTDYDPTYSLKDPRYDPDTTHSGLARKGSWSINMLSASASPEWAGELFYQSTTGSGALSGTGSASQLMSNAASWQTGAPGWILNDFANNMETDTAHDTSNTATAGAVVWRPFSYNGSNTFVGGVSPSLNDRTCATGGYVTDGAGGHTFKNAMAYSSRPTHYFDFQHSTWKPIPNNHGTGSGSGEALALGNWKAQEYAWHARSLGITIYTVGYGNAVDDSECLLLAQIANATNEITTEFNTNSISYNSQQPIGQQFYATTTNQISNDFYQVGSTINSALTQ